MFPRAARRLLSRMFSSAPSSSARPQQADPGRFLTTEKYHDDFWKFFTAAMGTAGAAVGVNQFVIGYRFNALENKFESVDSKFESVNSKMDALSMKIDAVSMKLQVKLDRISQQLPKLGGLKVAMTEDLPVVGDEGGSQV